MKRITFVRHGRSLADDERKFEGRYDSPLTEVGIAQAGRLAETWAHDPDRQYDLTIASTLSRACETARILCGALGMKCVYSELWMEMDNGALAGLTYDEGSVRLPKPAFVGIHERVAGGSGESRMGLHARAMHALEDLLNRDFRSAIVVAHGGILQAAARCALGITAPSEVGGTGFWFKDLSHMDLAFDETKDFWYLIEFGHLESE